MTKIVRSLLFVFVLASLLLAACGTSAPATEAPADPAAPAVEPTAAMEEPAANDPMAMYMPDAVDGDIVVAGSSTVFPLAERMIERFGEEGFGGNATYDSIGSGAGFERFCVAGESDVSGASRAIKGSERTSCRNIGREPIEFRVGTDALSVVVSKDNNFATDVTTEELALIFGTATNWSDVRPEWPNEPIQRFIPGTDSGTFDYFVEHVFKNDDSIILAASNTQLSEDDNVLVQGIEGSPYSIGFFGYAYYAENADKLNVLSVDGVEPTQATVDNNSYPLSRPLFLYSDAKIMQEKPQVAAFIYFFLAQVNNEIGDVGYFPANDTVLSSAMDAWMVASGQSEDMMTMYMPDAVDGDVVIAGSSTVFPLAERMIERFGEEGFGGNATYDSIGSGAGFERFCVAGESDISGASRAIKDSEVESCKAISRTPIEFRVGTDALSVVVSKDNTFATDVTTEELALIFGTATNWSDVRPEWPNEPIQRFIPGTDSGTFDYFVEHVYGNDDSVILAASNTQLSEDDNVLVQGVLGSPYAIGFFGYAYYAENADTLNVLSVDGVAPSQATVDDNSYPLSRPLFLYSDATILKDKPQAAAFIYFFLTQVNNEIGDVGYFPANPNVLDAAVSAWTEAIK